uniref:S5 DRBM domain-containing protein n=1 Tax=Grammatophora oceanica TaxID=210454 RepID=A0A7S1YM29_9STRA|mmetsp:Transcript_9090/g.13266  ORF Transcript_9090/g.13266 Transcript_9090/m.13266 type:complete len:371 (+) Transcript_9090:82-1194(+)|eukprot:CAMPEP_0194033210 /NCGR_PEP_ID=MMETSP0009_2-20130614/5978_1 /TAXON_ID=210454 /ORGANISM="Grammatophora oceanica, Strain CCMP 410" /LENGTH=370 /DNA_ID=CAMNT_0038673857 /DNA_START=60 /DNA_END=1172 /DNA_ORIENTATION=-
MMLSRVGAVKIRPSKVGYGGGRFFGSNNNGGRPPKIPFKPRRRPHPSYRPLDPVGDKRPPVPHLLMPQRDIVELGENDGYTQNEKDFGMIAGRMMNPDHPDYRITDEDFMRMANYMSAQSGTTEELIGDRRMLMHMTEEERKDFLGSMDEVMEEEALREESLLDNEYSPEENARIEKERAEEAEAMMEVEIGDDGNPIDPNQKAFGDWGDMTVRVDRVQKVRRGGTTVRYRALAVGGNANGCGGFGTGKAHSPQEAVTKACREAKRNIHFFEPHLGTGLTTDLVGTHNSCKVILLSVPKGYGLKGHPLIEDILKYFGISDATGKSFGNRNQFNVVRATFKALLTHQTLEEIALKRGKRLINIQKQHRFGV